MRFCKPGLLAGCSCAETCTTSACQCFAKFVLVVATDLRIRCLDVISLIMWGPHELF